MKYESNSLEPFALKLLETDERKFCIEWLHRDNTTKVGPDKVVPSPYRFGAVLGKDSRWHITKAKGEFWLHSENHLVPDGEGWRKASEPLNEEVPITDAMFDELQEILPENFANLDAPRKDKSIQTNS